MTNLRQHFEELDRLDAPDMRADIERRATAEPTAVPPRRPDGVSWRRGSLIAVATAVAVFVVVAVAVLLGQSVPSPIIDTPTSTVPVTTSTVAATSSTVPTTASTVPVTTSTVPVEGSRLTWSRVPYDEAAFHPAEDAHMVDVAAWGGGFVAVGWTNTPVPFESWDPDEKGGRVAWGEDAAVWLSPDGVTWTMVPNNEAPLGGLPGSQHINSVTTGGPGLVAVGGTMDDPEMLQRVEPSDSPFVSAVWTSEDGVNWTMSAAAIGSMNAVVRGGPGLVAVGDGVWTSPDGLAWEKVSSEALSGARSMFGVAAGTSGLVAVGDREGAGAVWSSPDGFTWTLHKGIHSEYNRGAGIHAVTATPDGFVGVGTEETIENACHDGAPGDCRALVWTSPDGITWTRVPHDESVFGGGLDKQMMSDVTTVGDQIVAVGTSVWTSRDGYAWTRVYQDPALTGEHNGRMYAVAANDNMIVIVGDDGASEMRPIDLPDGEQVEAWFSTASGIVWVGTAQQPDTSPGE